MGDDRKPMKRVTGLVDEKNRSTWIKIKNLFFAESIEEVKRNVLTDVVVPYIKNFVADTLINAVQRSIFGSGAPRTGYPPYRGTGYSGLARPAASRASYEPYYKKAPVSDLDTALYDPIIMRSWAKCQELVDVLQERIAECGNVTVNELNECLVDEKGDSRIGKMSDPFYGWTSLDGYSIIQRSASEWEVKLPKPVELDKKGRTYRV